MLFIIDSDERNPVYLAKMKERLQNNAKFHPLVKRELENYLLDASAVHCLIEGKLKTGVSSKDTPSVTEVAAAIDKNARSLMQRVVDLRVSQEVLLPTYPGRLPGCDAMEKLQAALTSLQEQHKEAAERIAAIRAEVSAQWDAKYMERAPGSEVLAQTLKEFGLTYNKDRDARRLAEYMSADALSTELKTLLRQFV